MGYGVVSANYRLSPKVMHPAHVEDAAAAYAWTVKQIKKYGGNPENIYISGHSAGAYLAVLIAIDDSYLKKHNLSSKSIKGTIAISPFLYVEETAKDRTKTVWGKDPENWLKASVTPHIGKIESPMLLIYADGDADWRKRQNKTFEKEMKLKRNTISSSQMPSRNHVSLISEINKDDDRIGELVDQFISTHK